MVCVLPLRAFSGMLGAFVLLFLLLGENQIGLAAATNGPLRSRALRLRAVVRAYVFPLPVLSLT